LSASSFVADGSDRRSKKKSRFKFGFFFADVFSRVGVYGTIDDGPRRCRDATLRAHVDAVHTRASDVRD